MKQTPSAKAFTDIVLQVFRTNGLLLTAGDRLAANEGISSAHWQVLGAIADEPLSVARIAKEMGLTRQSVQRIANILVENRTCSFEDNPLHKTAKLLKLTSKGAQIMSNMGAIQIRWANKLSKNLHVKDLEQTLDTLKSIYTILSKEKS